MLACIKDVGEKYFVKRKGNPELMLIFAVKI